MNRYQFCNMKAIWITVSQYCKTCNIQLHTLTQLRFCYRFLIIIFPLLSFTQIVPYLKPSLPTQLYALVCNMVHGQFVLPMLAWMCSLLLEHGSLTRRCTLKKNWLLFSPSPSIATSSSARAELHADFPSPSGIWSFLTLCRFLACCPNCFWLICITVLLCP